MKNNHPKRSICSITICFGLCFLSFLSCQHPINKNNEINSTVENKHQGVHVFGFLNGSNIQPLIDHHFNWITLVPYGAQKDIDSPKMIYYRGDSLKMARRDSMWKSQIDFVHAQGFNVFLKPHLWLDAPSNGKWRSDIFPTNETNWKNWQASYREFILYYAQIAEKNQVELFCVGTELSRLAVEKNAFWKSLIQDVRKVYSGKITYAANWYNAYEKITFWEDLDYIGVQAYFPLVKNKTPSVKQLTKSWKNYLPDLIAIHKKYNRKILFTELGYKSTADAAIEPWEWIDHITQKNHTLSMQTQANCYQAFFNTFWNKNWFAGVHVWQWRSDYFPKEENKDLDFTPQGKPTLKILKEIFK